MEELMTGVLFDCIEKQGATISDFDDVTHYPNRVRTADYNCSDFGTWEEAQKVFIRDGGPKKIDMSLIVTRMVLLVRRY